MQVAPPLPGAAHALSPAKPPAFPAVVEVDAAEVYQQQPHAAAGTTAAWAQARLKSDSQIEHLTSALPRPGGLIERMRQRGTLPAGIVQASAPQACSPGQPGDQRTSTPDAHPHGHKNNDLAPVVLVPTLGDSAFGSSLVPGSPQKLTCAHLQSGGNPLSSCTAVTPPATGAQKVKGNKMDHKRSGNKLTNHNALPLSKTWRKSIKAWQKKASNSDVPHVGAAPFAGAPAKDLGEAASPPVIRSQTPVSLAGDTREQSTKKPRPAVPVFAQSQQPQKQKLQPELEPWLKLRQMQVPPQNPEDNYEISDKGEDSDVDEPDRSEKHVPEWSFQYLELITKQTNIDPDTIFGNRVPECDLEAIFSDALYLSCKFERPKRRRGSSGEWKKDRLSRSEITDYKHKMGHMRRWSGNAENAPCNDNAVIVVS